MQYCQEHPLIWVQNTFNKQNMQEKGILSSNLILEKHLLDIQLELDDFQQIKGYYKL